MTKRVPGRVRSRAGTAAGAVVAVALALAVTGAPGCKSNVITPSSPNGGPVASITVTSSSFRPNGAIPVDETCDGKDVPPSLTWSAPPEGTQSIAVIVDDPDAPSGTFTHWLVVDLPRDAHTLGEGADAAALGAHVGTNDFGSPGYRGPCPPREQNHRYRFQVRALDKALGLPDGVKREAADAAMDGHVIGEGTLVGAYGR